MNGKKGKSELWTWEESKDRFTSQNSAEQTGYKLEFRLQPQQKKKIWKGSGEESEGVRTRRWLSVGPVRVSSSPEEPGAWRSGYVNMTA